MSGSRDTDDEAWRAIVENYGERAQVDDLPVAEEPAPAEPFDPSYDDLDEPEEIPVVDRFVPPDPGPGPRLEFPHHLPWLGVLGIPAFLLVSLLVSLDLPRWVGYLLVLGFVGSFVYLVFTMKRGGRDPWDDGARV